MTTRGRVVPALILGGTAALGITACDSASDVHACTRIGCTSEVEVVLTPPPQGAFRVELSSPGSLAQYVRDCQDATTCGRLVFPDFTPSYVSVRVTTSTDTVFVEAVPVEFQESQPNGPDCPPTCLHGRVEVALPG